MARYAKGVHAKAICDRCGLSYPYLSIRAEWNGLRTCPECWDYKHPSLDPITAVDAESLQFSRSGSHKREDARVVILRGVETPVRTGQEGIPLVSAGVTLSETGFAVTTTLNTDGFNLMDGNSIHVTETGLQVTTTVGTEALNISGVATPSGISVTTTVGTESIRSDTTLAVSNVTTTMALGNETPQAAAIESGFAVATAVGTEAVSVRGWGNNTWGNDTWGHD